MEHVNTDRVKSVEQVVVEGDPAGALLTAAVERAADLIVVGNRRLNALSGHLLGSVPGDVAHRAPCDVLIVQTTQVTAEQQPSA